MDEILSNALLAPGVERGSGVPKSATMKRTTFLVSSASLAAGAAGAALAAPSVPGGTQLVERLADFDETRFDSIVGRPARIRQVVEAVSFSAVTLNNVKNALNGLQFGFGYPSDGIAIALANHGPSTAFALTDDVWAKYRLGEYWKIGDATGKPLVANSFYPEKSTYDASASPDDAHGMYQDTSVQMLQRRGVIVLACHTAIEENARKLIAGGFAPSGATPEQVADDLLTHLVPGAVVVPSMVATIAVLQAKYHYTYLNVTT
jgi:intracellular sulfur oxidation DsrE/DsrF family protein